MKSLFLALTMRVRAFGDDAFGYGGAWWSFDLSLHDGAANAAIVMDVAIEQGRRVVSPGRNQKGRGPPFFKDKGLRRWVDLFYRWGLSPFLCRI